MTVARMRWGRVLVGGFLSELLVFATAFSVLFLFGQSAFLASVVIASGLMPLVFAWWVGRVLESRFMLHGALVGLVAALLYTSVAWGQPQPLLYQVAHGFKIAGGMAGGWLAQRRWRAAASAVAVQSAL